MLHQDLSGHGNVGKRLATDCRRSDTNFKVNPPLRSRSDIEDLLAGVRDGTITILATDHAPHTQEDKELEFAAAPYGMIGLESALPLYIQALIDTETIDWPRLISMMTSHPAQLCGFKAKGSLSPGADADVTVIDPALTWAIDANNFACKSRNCPFDGWNVCGRAIATIVGGQIKYVQDPQRFKPTEGEMVATCPQDLVGLYGS